MYTLYWHAVIDGRGTIKGTRIGNTVTSTEAMSTTSWLFDVLAMQCRAVVDG
jgi:hypothetical protein